MKVQDQNKVVSLGFAFFAAIFGFTFLLLMLVSLGVFVALGITSANESGDNTEAGIGIAGGIFAVIFYCVLAVLFVLPTALASWKTYKRRQSARVWGTIAAILILPIMPLGTMLGVFALWFFFSDAGKHYYSNAV